MRKVIQITATQAYTQGKRLYTLCNDGTMWVTGFYKDLRWQKLPDIPQDSVGKQLSDDELIGGKGL